MKLKLILLTILTILTFQSYSQKSSNDSISCVPTSSLRKALVMKTNYKKLLEEITIVRDSNSILLDIISNKDTIIDLKEKQIVLYKDKEDLFKKQLTIKDKQIELYKNKFTGTKRKFIFISGVGGIIITLLILL